MNVSWYIPRAWKWPWQKNYNFNKMPASSWIRCLQLIPYLNELGITSQINRFDDDTQIAVFLRRWTQPDQELAKQLKKRNIKIVLDSPVNYFSKEPLAPFLGGIRDDFLTFSEIADIILCPSQYIRDFGLKQGYHTICLEDSINLKHFNWRKKKDPSNNSSVLIWSGISVKATGLNIFAPAINKNNWTFIIISDKKPDLDFKFKFIKWNYNSFPQDILKGDIGIFPRTADNEYDAGHSFFKIGIFLAQHIPVVCSPVPSYQQITNDSNSISIPDMNADSWKKAVLLIMKQGTFFDFSDNPVYNYSTKIIAKKYQTVFTNLL